MANWYFTSFKTKDKRILSLIENESEDFQYEEDNNNGRCRLPWGISSLNLELIDKIVTENKASVKIEAYDVLTGVHQKLEYVEGKEVVCASYFDSSLASWAQKEVEGENN